MTGEFALEKLITATGEKGQDAIQETTTLLLREDADFLEKQLCRQTGMSHCVTVSKMELGLYIALRACGVMMGDKVLCSGLAPGYVLRAILRAGGEPVMVDINPNTYCIDPYCLDYAVGRCVRNRNRQPRVLIASDAFGLPCNYEDMELLCEQYGIDLIEDGSGTSGASSRERKAGSFGRFSVIDYADSDEQQDEINIAAVLCRGEEDYELLQRMLRQCSAEDGETLEATCKSTVKASIARQRLEDASRRFRSRQRIAREYQALLEGHVKMQSVPEDYVSAYSKFVIAVPDPERRERIAVRLRKQEIPCMVLRPAGLEAEGAEWEKIMLRNTQNAYGRLLYLPIYSYLTGSVVSHIAQQVIEEIERVD